MAGHEAAHPSYRAYVLIFVGLAILTALTVLISYTGLSVGQRDFLAFAIATVKALMVAIIFMHLKYEKPILIIFAVVPIFLAILFILAISPDIGVATN